MTEKQVQELTDEILETLRPLLQRKSLENARLGVELAIRRVTEPHKGQSRPAASLAK